MPRARVPAAAPVALLAALASAATAGAAGFPAVPDEEARSIAAGVLANETGGDGAKLVWWNAGERFPSLGIGHFIWYHPGKRGPFDESFPKLLAYMKGRGVALPQWLAAAKGSPIHPGPS